MGLLDRTLFLVRANVNDWLSQREDPEKTLEQAVEQLWQEMRNMRQAVAQAIATQKRTQRQFSQAQTAAQEWHRRAQLALVRGNEQLAKEALLHRQSHQNTAQTLHNHLEQQQEVITRLKQQLRILEGKITAAKAKKDMYIARARSAVASQRINEIIGTRSLNNSSFERMEEKVLELEAHAELSE